MSPNIIPADNRPTDVAWRVDICVVLIALLALPLAYNQNPRVSIPSSVALEEIFPTGRVCQAGDPVSMEELIRIRGARAHNLRSIDVNVPRGKLVVFTGVSGSGKSSLVFDTIFAEGQRRYIESLSPFTRRYLDQLPPPDVDVIDGLPPTLSVAQTGYDRSASARSIVATMTDVHDFLRVLYARVGLVRCYRCQAPLGTRTREEIVESVASLPEGERILILAPLVHGRPGAHREAFATIRREGFIRARVDDQLLLIDPVPELDASQHHSIDLVVDRQIVRPDLGGRLIESIDTALRLGRGTVIIAPADAKSGLVGDRVFNTRLACSACEISYRELEPRTFSFNSPYGACPNCQGLGIVQGLSPSKIMPDPGLSLAQGAIAPFRSPSGRPLKAFRADLETWATTSQELDIPWTDLPQHRQQDILHGTPTFPGVLARLDAMLQSKKESLREIIEPFLDVALCPECVGERIGPEGRNVLIADKRLPELIALPIAQTRQFLADWSIPPDRLPIAHPLVLEIQRRLDFLIDVGVGYIELDRPVASLSGGEAQRIRLASSIGSGLDGACFVLDEPTSGLHPRDTDRLLDLLTQLRDRGNSVLVVEHDPAAMARADWIIDIGPGAGVLGGQVVHEGTRDSFQPGQGLTADYLGGARTILPEDHQPSPVPQSHPQLSFTGVRHRNLQEIDVSIPLCRFVAVTGVSGSGKSTLVTEVIVPAVRQALGKVGPAPGAYREMIGVEAIADLVEVDQAPIGRTPRSCPASFCGAWDAIRHVFARTRDAKLRGFKAGRFSFNSPQGACPACRGLGHRRVRMGFLPDAFVLCETCRGRRFNPSTLAIKYRDQSPADILAMNVAQAVAFFVNHPRVLLHLQPLVEVGLGYLTLGQSATTLSGGEAQRLKLATHLADRRADSTLYVLDEPTTGLHLDDIRTLLAMLLRLVVRGASVLVIEHHTGVIAAADWIIDLGPEGGAKGGRVLAHGTPADVAQTADTPTARALRNHLQLPHRPAPPSVHP